MNTKSLRKLWKTSKSEQARAWNGIHKHKQSERDFGEYSFGLGERVDVYGDSYAEAADLSELKDATKSEERLRSLGWPLKSARKQAREMQSAAMLAERGALRLLFVSDSCAWSAEDLFGDCIRPSEERRLWKEAEETGVFSIVCEVKDDSGEWIFADSVCGFFGEQDATLFGNPYVADALASGVEKCAEHYAEQVREFWSEAR